MLELTKNCVKTRREDFEKAGICVPGFDINALAAATAATPRWAHIGTGNLFKAYHAALAQKLIESGDADTGVITVVPSDFDSIDSLYRPHDNLILRVVMKADGSLEKQVIGSVTDVIAADTSDGRAWGALKAVFANPSLQMVSLAITEKGYELKGMNGHLRPEIAAELDAGLLPPSSIMLKLCALLYERFSRAAAPLAIVSTDNFSHNGDRLKAVVLLAASEWQKRGIVGQDFVDYLNDETKIAFPLSMIDKITPYPSQRVADELEKSGLAGMKLKKSPRGSVTAAFVNTEEAEYLVIEDRFPNGRPPLEKAGVYFTDRETVDKVERMKVSTCLNPLHTALAVFGCLLGYTSIAAEMADGDLSRLVNRIAYDEGMPVVTDPGIIKPEAFVKEVLAVRFPNPNIPDTPQRIATDTSQKIPIRFGGTIKAYMDSPALKASDLKLIPLVLAAWIRYLLGIDDEGNTFETSPDPMLPVLRQDLKGIEAGKPETAKGRLRPILSNEKIFAVNLYEAGLAERIEGYFCEMLAGNGAIRKTLRKYL
jgi:fructuronate reductase